MYENPSRSAVSEILEPDSIESAAAENKHSTYTKKKSQLMITGNIAAEDINDLTRSWFQLAIFSYIAVSD